LDGCSQLRPLRRRLNGGRLNGGRLNNRTVRDGINKCRGKVLVACSWHGLDAWVPYVEVCVDRSGQLRTQLAVAGGTKGGGVYPGGEPAGVNGNPVFQGRQYLLE
jgi:hypothetical protein